MPAHDDIALMAHLMRRAGFGATRGELEALAEQGYERTVEQLLHPESRPEVDEYELYRYHPQTENPFYGRFAQVHAVYHMVNSRRPLQEKMALLWHQVFATALSKLMNSGPPQLLDQMAMFRSHGMGSFHTLVQALAKNPAMIYWLDNNENHKRAPNENWGRELLELFSMGVGSYTEHDVYECARAFTGWTFKPVGPSQPWGPNPWWFEYHPEDHDSSEKTFLGETGRFNGEDIIQIIVNNPACPRFVARHLYSFFVADEAQVHAWSIEPPRDPQAVALLAETLVGSNYELRPVLRTLFNSDFFKEARFRRLKSPVEVLVGTLKLTGKLAGPHPDWGEEPLEAGYMGQDVLNPPSVEGWHTGEEWVNSGALINRVNYVADRVSDTRLPGVRDIVGRVASEGTAISSEALVDRCLDLMGPLEVEERTRELLIDHVDGANGRQAGFSERVGELLALIAATREYQFC